MAEIQATAGWASTKNRQIAAAVLTLITMVLLAFLQKWPFHQQPDVVGQNGSIWELLLSERITLGLIRSGLAAVVVYAVTSIPALIVGGRWMKGLSTSGLTADDADSADEGIEELQSELQATRDELNNQLMQNDFLSQLLLERKSPDENDPPEEGST